MLSNTVALLLVMFVNNQGAVISMTTVPVKSPSTCYDVEQKIRTDAPAVQGQFRFVCLP